MAPANPSKSVRKKEQLALQALGERLVELSDEQLAAIPLDESLREAVLDARSIRARGALRRQRQLIGKLMRQVDPEPIRAALEQLLRRERQDKALFRRAESWRDRLLTEGRAALRELEREAGRSFDGLRILADRAGIARDDAARRRIGRQIFRELHTEFRRQVQKRPG